MALVGTVLVWILAVVGVLLALLVALPWSVRASGAVAIWRATGEVAGDWGLGLVGFRWSREDGAWFRLVGLDVLRIRSDDEDVAQNEAALARREAKRAIRAERREQRREAKRARREAQGRREPGPLFWLGWAARNRGLFYRLVRALHLGGGIQGRVGTGDPADTATLAVLIDPVLAWIPGSESGIAWDYLDEALYLEGQVRARVWLLELLGLALVTLVRGESRRALLARP